MDFHWKLQDGVWVLSPSMITVREADGFWVIHANETPMQGRYTSVQGAKLDAWQFAESKRRVLFGTYGKIRLTGERQ